MVCCRRKVVRVVHQEDNEDKEEKEDREVEDNGGVGIGR